MQNNDDLTKKELGFRFLMFRKAIRKTEMELASELNITEAKINAIETGVVYPDVAILHYLYKTYGLNIHWLLTRVGHMFIEQKSQPEKTDSLYDRYAELIDLMEVPAVEQAIKAALTEIRALLVLGKEKDYK
ncbi:MAG: Helix-turn-helix protein [Acidobacteriota bacterium]|nr:Helix-turn-helix protein [Acidobacteriota bacterium]